MLFPFNAYTNLGCGVALIAALLYTVQLIRQGSKSDFAYILLTFTFLDAAQELACFFICAFPYPVYIGNSKYHAMNQYANLTANYCFYFVSLQ